MKHIPEWRTRGMLSYLAKLGVFTEKNDAYTPTESLKQAFGKSLRAIHEKGELQLENFDEKINEAIIDSLIEHRFFKESKSTREVAFAVEIIRTFLDDSWIENIGKALGI